MPLAAPEITEISRPYWESLQQGRLMFQRCECGHAWLPARRECPSCLGDKLRWEQAGGKGRLVSWVVYHTAYHDAFKHRLPYNVAIVELAEGPRLITNMVDPHERLVCDAAVELRMESDEGITLARFALSQRRDDEQGTGNSARQNQA